MRIIIVQPALPRYRWDFFCRLYQIHGRSLEVYYSPGSLGVLSSEIPPFDWATEIGAITSVIPGVEWQRGALSIKIFPSDIVVISGGPRCLSNIFLLVKCRLSGARTIWWGQYWGATTIPHRHIVRLYLMKMAHGLCFYTDREVRLYKKSWGKSDLRPIVGLNNGLDIGDIRQLRANYDSNQRSRAILFIGRLTKKASVDLLLSALSKQSLHDVTAHVIGDGEERCSLEAQCKTEGTVDRVIWHGGLVDESQIALIANSCRIFVYPGSVGLSLIHGMAYGLPVIIHNDPKKHMPEVAAFTNGETGRGFKRDDAGSLAEVLFDVLDDYGQLSLWSRCALKRVESTFNTEAMAHRFDALVGEMLDYPSKGK